MQIALIFCARNSPTEQQQQQSNAHTIKKKKAIRFGPYRMVLSIVSVFSVHRE